MRANTRLAQISALFLVLGACGDDVPETPLAEIRVDVPPPLPETEQPRVLLLLDTSGSMQWREGCTCSTPACTECLPNCEAGERSRWHGVLEALTGSFAKASCESVARTPDNEVFTYDRNYPIPNVALTGEIEQRDDGLLTRYGAYVRFGLATFDSVGAYGADTLIAENAFDWDQSRKVAGMSSYAGVDPDRSGHARVRADGSVVGRVFYPASAGPYLIDTGIRSQYASEGALVLPRSAEETSARHARITEQLMGVRPFGTSPVAAALDDVYFALRRSDESNTQSYVVLISDGLPDDDYRTFPSPGCDCASWESCGENPNPMSCPYPLPADAARHLRCGFSDSRCVGPVTWLFVIAQATQDETLQTELGAIAAAGGSDAARFVSGLSELNAALDSVLMRIVQETSR
jgi:hypothetical protein